jgi:phenylacetate-CoA ligase
VLSIIKKIYDSLPKEHLKFLRYIPNRLLFGKSYSAWKNKVSFDKTLIERNLFDTLNYAREHTQYGKDHIPKAFNISDVHTILESLPMVTSHDVATNLSYYASDEFNRFNAYTTTTGGTGRNPTAVILSNEAYGIEWAHALNFWSLTGYDRKRDIRLTLRGKNLSGDKLVEYNPIYNEVVVDVYKVNDNNFKKFIQEIKKYDIKYIFAYPSLIKEYMIYFEKYNYIPDVKGIFLSSEEINTEDKQVLSKFFNSKVLSMYGQTEKVTFAADTEANGMHRVYTSYGYPRVVDGEIVATTFVNRALPLINYKIGDGAELVEDDDSLYLKNITSRRGKDFIYLTKEKKVSLTLLAMHTGVENEVLYYQFHQKEFGKIEIRLLQKINSIMSSEKLSKTFNNAIKAEIPDFDIIVNVVNENEIIKSHRGKMILLVQNLIIETNG